jgi:ribonuclease PH
MNADGDFIEIQGTSERTPFSLDQLDQMLELASTACSDLILKQQQIITSAL